MCACACFGVLGFASGACLVELVLVRMLSCPPESGALGSTL